MMDVVVVIGCVCVASLVSLAFFLDKRYTKQSIYVKHLIPCALDHGFEMRFPGTFCHASVPP
jgi:hypothetical protein